ncbi:hypothetical protein AMTRI_Chr13g83640 [Amborella trichopoda]
MEEQKIVKHFCRICKKGFGCGRALGGHMRAHGVSDENVGPSGRSDDEDPSGDWAGGGSGVKRMYALRTNPNRFKNSRVCENCGEEFTSWKLFLEHGRCASGAESPDSGQKYGEEEEEEEEEEDDEEREFTKMPLNGAEERESTKMSPNGRGGNGEGWGWGKRLRRARNVNSPNCPSSEEEDLAHCLVMLASAKVDPPTADTESSCASATRDEEEPDGFRQPPSRNSAPVSRNPVPDGVSRPPGLFECKACKKLFNSHQALGGHRASHKKVKGCFAKVEDQEESLLERETITKDGFTAPRKMFSLSKTPSLSNPNSSTPQAASSRKRSKIHECSECHRVFTSGQALGGHKRCHWVTSNTTEPPMAKTQLHQENPPKRLGIEKATTLDLNLPAPTDDVGGLEFKSWFCVGSDDKGSAVLSVEDEGDSTLKLGKLSDLKDMGLNDGSTPWLQVGIGSSSNPSEKG